MWSFETPANNYWRAPTLEKYDVYFVSVCGFKFEFHSIEQIRACLKYYSVKIHPSSRMDIGGADNWEMQRWYERLPMYLREEPKRQKVVKALQKALSQFAEDN